MVTVGYTFLYLGLQDKIYFQKAITRSIEPNSLYMSVKVKKKKFKSVHISQTLKIKKKLKRQNHQR